MNSNHEKIPNPKEIEKEIGDFLTKKFGDSVKVVSPVVMPLQMPADDTVDGGEKKEASVAFDLKPEELIAYLDQYIVRQDAAKEILATKICTHFNRIRQSAVNTGDTAQMVGSIKNNVLMLGPTGVGKTYIIKLIANKLGVPFVKGDATKFSETGYVGGDVEDLVRDLVREADDDIERAEHGIIYIDEIDKIASTRSMMGADVSRTGVQRALLKPMEETEVDLKVPHDPISMIQEIERFRKTGDRDKRTVNTRNILFIMSGAFAGLSRIIEKRLTSQPVGFGADIKKEVDRTDIFSRVKSEDLIAYGFESEFVGRLPVRAVFERLAEKDLLAILENPNNPVVLGKKLDFAAYGIRVKFDDAALAHLAANAFLENTGARGLVSAVEQALLPFERRLPSTRTELFAVNREVVENPVKALADMASDPASWARRFEGVAAGEKDAILRYLADNRETLAEKHGLALTPARMDLVANFYTDHIMDIGLVMDRIKSSYDDAKKIELRFYENHDINMVMEDDAVDFIIEQHVNNGIGMEAVYRKISADFEHGLKLVREKSGRNRFFISRRALISPEQYIAEMIRLAMTDPPALPEPEPTDPGHSGGP
jgi:ATP-dependent Clp protease ATP-binding subunit ClpX